MYRIIATASLMLLCLANGPLLAMPQSASLSAALERETLAENLDQQTSIADIAPTLSEYRLVGLGETSHGQAEMFEFRRKLTVELIRNHDVQIVYFETGNAAASVINQYINGANFSLDEAIVAGFDLQIWHIPEVGALIADLREWNDSATNDQKVRFVGVDFQNPRITGAYIDRALAGAVEDTDDNAYYDLAEQLELAVYQAWNGDADSLDQIDYDMQAAEAKLSEIVSNLPEQQQSVLRLFRDLQRYIDTARTPGGRDRGMADSLLSDLSHYPESRAVLWGHNMHINTAPMRYMRVDEVAMGQWLRDDLGQAYYALGFIFGEGGFSAMTTTPEGIQRLKQYHVGQPPIGALGESFFETDSQSLFIDFRTAGFNETERDRLSAPRGQRFWGGYGVGDDPQADTADAQSLVPTQLNLDYDGIAYFRRTTATNALFE